jgi:hypothetical protein
MCERSDKILCFCLLNSADNEFPEYFQGLLRLFSLLSCSCCPFLSWIGITHLSSQGASPSRLCLCVKNLTLLRVFILSLHRNIVEFYRFSLNSHRDDSYIYLGSPLVDHFLAFIIDQKFIYLFMWIITVLLIFALAIRASIISLNIFSRFSDNSLNSIVDDARSYLGARQRIRFVATPSRLYFCVKRLVIVAVCIL